MKKIYLFAALAAMLAACSENDLTKENAAVQQTGGEGTAVTFDVYTNRATTRAGWAGEVTTNGLREQTNEAAKLGASGFGVFGYYTNNNTYDQQAIPNFFYNQQVKYDGAAFSYEPVKYWPNEYGQTAISDDADKVTFFAYAPWVEVVPSTGKVKEDAEAQKWGINSMTRNSATGDPLVKYLVSFDPTHSVDLCWGVCDDTSWPRVLTGSTQEINENKPGFPWKDVERPADATGSQKLKFTFKHALSKLNVQIDTYVDGVSASNVSTGTKVYVRSITFEGLADKGALNLNNTEAGANKAYWMEYAGTNDLVTGESVTIYDGRKDGKEGTLGGEATNEKVLGLNPNLVQSTLWKSTPNTEGVLGAAQNLFRKWNPTGGADGKGAYEAAGLFEPVYVIPTGDAVKVTIVYDVETADGNLSTYLSDGEQTGSSIENRITKSITFGKDASNNLVEKLESGKAYTLKLHLGMNSVKFDASVSTWEDNAANDVDLPANVPVYEAKTTPDIKEIILPYDADKFMFAISGLDPYETVTKPSAVTNLTFADATANASGIALETVTITLNTSVKKVGPNSVTWGSTKKVTTKFTQQAHPLGLSVLGVNYTLNSITLKSTASGMDWDTDINDKVKDITVTKNGIKLTTIKSTDPDPTATQVKNNDDGRFTLGSPIKPGDVYTFTVKAGDAPQESCTVTIGGVAYATTVVPMAIGKPDFTNPLTFYGNGTITYTSSDETIATIDATGKVHLVGGKGSTTITATATPVTGNYFKTEEASYSVLVGDAIFEKGGNYTMSLSAAYEADPKSLYISGTISTAEVTKGDGDVINGDVTIDNTTTGISKITFTKRSNGGSARSQKITLTSGSESMTITLDQAGV